MNKKENTKTSNMKISESLKKRMWAVLNAAENDSGSYETEYATIYIYNDGPNKVKQLTLSRGITQYGNMKSLLQMYINDGGKYSNNFKPYVDILTKSSTVKDSSFKALLIKAAKEDQIFRTAEDKIFDDKYLRPALEFADKNGFGQPLSLMVILDSYLHSGTIFDFLRTRFPEKTPAKGGNEKIWIKEYVDARHSWLANHSNRILQNTTYRTQFLKNQIKDENWYFNPPVVMNGTKIPF